MVPVALALVAAFIFVSLLSLGFNKRHRGIVLERLGFGQPQRTELFTPPQTLSPEKHGLPRNEKPATPGYSDVFPPHGREELAKLQPDALTGPGKSAKELSYVPPSYSKLTPDKEGCNSNDKLNHTTPTGFTVEEIIRLGDFPDYATLSGVPLPEAYNEFDIRTAKPRPYRPLRWAYHQTMSLMKLESDWWLELHSTYVDVIRQRLKLFEEYGDSTLRALPGSELAVKELMEMAVQFLCAR